MPILTVEEMLLYTAELKRPLSEPLQDKKAAVGELLNKLALTDCRWVSALLLSCECIFADSTPCPVPADTG